MTTPLDSASFVFVFEESPRRVRPYLAGTALADSTRMMLLHESGRLPVYYFPLEDVRAELLEPSEHTTADERRGEAIYWHARVGERLAENAVWAHRATPERAPDLSGHVAFVWNAMDAWFEEDEQVYKHARDPYHRVDVASSSRHVRVVVAGETVAETRQPHLLFETGLPTRYYIPKLDVRLDLLASTDTTSVCPYKGTASYYSATVGGTTVEDVAWYYEHPIVECPKIENLVCFFNEKVEIQVDGELQDRPQTQWS